MRWLVPLAVAARFTIAAGGPNAVAPPAFHFYCNVGYTTSECASQSKRLRDVLSAFEVSRLGEWNWILVRSDDWRSILYRAHRNPDSPAFTILDLHETFLEEALFAYTPPRSRTLLEEWRLPLDQLLRFAVSHELGHALCHETSEVLTDAYATQLRRTGMTMCTAPVTRPGDRGTPTSARTTRPPRL